jgi:quaternary ammonium compound-resistance protein SugE
MSLFELPHRILQAVQQYAGGWNLGWVFLILAGVMEIGFTTFLKLSDTFTRLWPSVGFIVCALSSLGLLTLAMKSIPLGTAYAVWTGIGAFGTAVVGILFYGDPHDCLRLFFLALLIGAIIGLRLVSGGAG